MPERNPRNAPGPFYVERGACICCGAPEEEAPDLIDYHEDDGCYFRRQPETPAEVDAAIQAVRVSCVRAYRYGGDDVEVRRRLAQIGEADACDEPVPDGPEIVRNHVRFEHRGARTARDLAELLRAWFPRDRIALVDVGEDRALLEIPHGHEPWSRLVVGVHRVGVHTWLLFERSGGRLPAHLHDVLVRQGATRISWLSAEEHERGEAGQPRPE